MERLLGNEDKLKHFYLALEDRFRGSKKEIKKRLRLYLPIAEMIENYFDNSKIIDIGCGRGEWLELLSESKIKVTGIDSNCYEDLKKKYEFIETDALIYLKNLPSNSIHLISAYHFIEHVNEQEQVIFMIEAHRVLSPGGVIILETPNVDNLTVSNSTFYLDPTHNKPVVSDYLNFLADFAGFKNSKTILLGESNSDNPNLWDIFSKVSRDFSIICQKGGDQKISKLFKNVQLPINGSSMMEITDKYEKANNKRLNSHLNKINGHLEKIDQSFTKINQNLKILNERSNNYQIEIDYFKRLLNPIIKISIMIQKIKKIFNK